MKKVSPSVLFVVLIVVFSFSGALRASDLMDPPKLRKPRTVEGLIVEGGAAFPSLWGIHLLVPVVSGGMVGIAAQGTYDGYTPSDAAPSHVTTFDVVIGYGYPRWSSILKGSGVGAFLGAGTLDRSYANTPWHMGVYGNLSVTFIRSGLISFGMFLRPQVSFLITNYDKNGAVGEAKNDRDYSLGYGGRLSFSFN